jgi:hypothetical protein
VHFTVAAREDPMADPIVVIVRFSGDTDTLLERFEKARRRWMEA